MNEKTVIEIKNLRKEYAAGEIKIPALSGIDLTITEGEFTAVMGASGSGKSTLMNIIGCLDKPTSGEYYLDGINTAEMTKDEHAAIRNEKIGFIFQGFNLLPRVTAAENVELPIYYSRSLRQSAASTLAVSALERVGLGERIHHMPNQLSGGQQQRVAIARALVNKPALLIADEPTGNLDSITSMEIFQLFQQLNDEGITIVMVTHERDFARFAKRIIEMRDGRILNDSVVKDRMNASSLLADTRRQTTVIELHKHI